MAPLPAAVRVTAEAARALRHLKPWVWRKDVVEPPDAPGGAVVAVLDPRGQPAGQALWAARSPLALRLLTRRPPSEERGRCLVPTRLRASIARRVATAREARQRLVHAEADGLPASSSTATGTGWCSRRLRGDGRPGGTLAAEARGADLRATSHSPR